MIELNDTYGPRKNSNILLTDIDTDDVHTCIPSKLNIKYLAEAQNELNGNMSGIMYGVNLRLFCATTIKIKNKIKMIIFLVDTGSSETYISEEVLRSFRIELADPLNDSIHVSINNKGEWVKMSHSHFKDICILGMRFLTSNKVGLHAFCGDDIFYLNFDEELKSNNDEVIGGCFLIIFLILVFFTEYLNNFP
ncbi:unnamed protein product [Rhizophagus irregularis]|uniref:Uncharacterized protein n=1 Tax=Rhizophagus irregularis TaxID=588596 RepID=A0A2N1MP66_9GLOM|nr:hypothetical protein RhiirC2_717005 [Rhizophagus irregularis]CAB4400066.1 unnamed protein product [Rhizophagus irregularis]CAB5350154.1 unnamed protein product [Rhizophagus irregularis]